MNERIEDRFAWDKTERARKWEMERVSIGGILWRLQRWKSHKTSWAANGGKKNEEKNARARLKIRQLEALWMVHDPWSRARQINKMYTICLYGTLNGHCWKVCGWFRSSSIKARPKTTFYTFVLDLFCRWRWSTPQIKR